MSDEADWEEHEGTSPVVKRLQEDLAEANVRLLWLIRKSNGVVKQIEECLSKKYDHGDFSAGFHRSVAFELVGVLRYYFSLFESPQKIDEALREPRVQVARFAYLMERILQDNDWKGSWENVPLVDLFKNLEDEVEELKEALLHRSHGCSDCHPRFVSREAADVANLAMMIADVCGALPDPAKEETFPPRKWNDAPPSNNT